MEERATADFIWFGMAVRYVHDVREGTPIHGDRYLLANIDAMLDRMVELDLPVSARIARQAGLEDLRDEFRKAPSDAVLDSATGERLMDAMDHIWTAVIAEASGKYAYVLTDKRFSVERLTEDVGALFPPGVLDSLSHPVQFDLEEAGKCIAFERPTAAAFHTMRAIEGTLRDFYRAVVRQKRLKEPWLWKPMLDQMRGRSKPPPTSLLDQLDSIREHFRNPTQHPDAAYDIYEAQELFSGALDVISRMSRLGLRH